MGVISNEFGALGIDAVLFGQGEERFVELAGGCVCCKLSDELIDTLEAMRARNDPDRIVIETSGVALPFETQLNLYRPPVNAWVGDEATVVVVDAEQMDHGGETLEDQVSGADLLILNKCDLVIPDTIAACLSRLADMSPDTPILTSTQADVSLDVLFPAGPRPRLAAASTDAHPAHHHEAFVSEELRVPDGLSALDAEIWIGERRGLRTKGFVRTTDGPRVVQGVGRRLELTKPTNLTIPDDVWGRVVVIRRA